MKWRSILKKTGLALLTLMLLGVVALALIGGGFGQTSAITLKGWSPDSLLLIAHRGSTVSYPDNSLGGLRRASQRGFSAVEIDVQRSSDGHFFLFHDRETAPALGVNGVATSFSLGQLQKYPLLFRGEPTTEHVLSLQDYFDSIGKDLITYLDIKRQGQRDFRQLAASLNAILLEKDLYDRVIVSNANVLFIAYLEFTYPRIHTCLEALKPPMQHVFFWIPRRFRPDFIATFYNQVNDAYLGWLQHTGMIKRYITFTVKDRQGLDKMERWGVRMIIVDDGSYLDEQLPKIP